MSPHASLRLIKNKEMIAGDSRCAPTVSVQTLWAVWVWSGWAVWFEAVRARCSKHSSLAVTNSSASASHQQLHMHICMYIYIAITRRSHHLARVVTCARKRDTGIILCLQTRMRNTSPPHRRVRTHTHIHTHTHIYTYVQRRPCTHTHTHTDTHTRKRYSRRELIIDCV